MEKVKVNGEEIEYEVTEKDGVYTITVGNESATFQVFKYSNGYMIFNEERNVFLNLDVYKVKEKTIVWLNEEKLVVEEEMEETISAAEEESDTNIKSPMPGTIKEVKFKKGETVVKGDTVIVLESMKVLNELKSSIDGTIKEIRVKEGDQVGPSELLAVIEPS